MISINQVSKSFDDIKAIQNITLSISERHVFGLLGTNGAGKSTLLRMMAGVLKSDQGDIKIDDISVWDNEEAKAKCFYISDDQFYFPNSTPDQMASFYQKYYPDFDFRQYEDFMINFDLDRTRKIQTFSKGMKKQLSIILGLSANTTYLFCDETFDGLDPVMRQGIKSIFAEEITSRGLTPVIASHNLRELEDICDSIGLLHKGGVLLSEELDDLKCNLHKIQCVLPDGLDVELHNLFNIASFNQHGRLITMIIRGDKSETLEKLETLEPVYLEALPLSLEEIFIKETEGVGYDIKNLIL